MRQHKTCATVVLAHSAFCSVSHCRECGMYHLHIGPMSLRLRNEAFAVICETVTQAYRHKHKPVENVAEEHHVSARSH